MGQRTKLTASGQSENLVKQIEQLGPWFHNIRLPDGTETAPNHVLGDFPSFKWRQLSPHLPEDLTGWSVLDIGCNAGYYSFELARRGASVTGIDVNEHYLAQARWLGSVLGLSDRVCFERMQVYELAHTSETYDLILFMGVLYHLRYPMLGLDIVAQKVRRLLVMQTLSMPGRNVYPTPESTKLQDRASLQDPGWPALAFIEHQLAMDPTNWFIPNHAACEAMLRSAGMRIIGYPLEEAYLCEPDPDHPAAMTTWNRSEYLAAIDQRPVS